jgi:signal transduction histidine kinase
MAAQASGANVLQFPSAIADGGISTHDLAVRAADWIRKWFSRSTQRRLDFEREVRLEERLRERARIARDLHDSLFQGFLVATIQVHAVMQRMPPGSTDIGPLNRACQMMERALDEGRAVLEGLHSSDGRRKSLEQAFCSLRDELSPTGAVLRVFVTGKSKSLRPVTQEQIYLIGREALINALRHSQAKNIEAEVEYHPRRLRLIVRDDGCGMDPRVVRSARDGHWGLVGMRERAGSIGAKLHVWSRPGLGTEIELCVPGDAQLR